ncbi:MAG: hypothetical protein ACP5LR_08815, partial [Athalassotoga sp.]|uniref:hypothetical protein n=1 Tax=Athalassotoga sp. TaxID=2022597 RepID=UPI003CFC0B3B
MFLIVWESAGKPDTFLVAIDWTIIQKRYLFMASIPSMERTLPIAFILTDRKVVRDRLALVVQRDNP